MDSSDIEKFIERIASFGRYLERVAERLQRKTKNLSSRRLTESDTSAWLEDAYNPVKEHLKKKNFYRWARLQSDIKWVKKEMVKMSLDPEEVRWWIT